jgi:hypothetical protein
VNVNPITFPSVRAMIGFLLVIMDYVTFAKNIDEAFIISEKLSDSSIIAGLLKFVRSFPEEKLPPYPVKTINFTFSFFWALFIASLRDKYISIVKALYLFGLLNLIVIRGPDTSTIVFFSL